MTRPSKERMAWISSRMAARALTRAADPEVRDQLVGALLSWLPDADLLTRRELAVGVAEDFGTLANAIDARLEKLVQRGVADPYVSPDVAG
jgi:hypothetical protein